MTFYLVFSNYNKDLKMLKSLLLFVTFATGISNEFVPEKHKNWKMLPHDTCGQVTSSRIIGGKEAPMNSLPWIGVIGYKKPNSSKIKFACGAALLTKKIVITAAHCISTESAYKVAVVRFGEHNLDTDPDCELNFCADPVKDIEPDVAIVHENYTDSGHSYDIALIKLKKEVEFTHFVKPICLPRGKIYKKNFENSTAEVAGWGVSEKSKSNHNSPKLLKVTLPILNLKKCQEYVPKTIKIEKSQMCAGGVKNKDSCDGDSGGPFMKVEETENGPFYFLIGLVSFGAEECGKENTPAIYTRITYYLNWILNNLGNEVFEARVEKF